MVCSSFWGHAQNVFSSLSSCGVAGESHRRICGLGSASNSDAALRDLMNREQVGLQAFTLSVRGSWV